MKRTKKKIGVLALLLLSLVCVNLLTPTSATTPKLNTTKKTVVKGQTVKLKVKNTTKTVKWSSSNKKIATIKSSGKTGAVVKTKKAGKVTITAKIGSKKLKCRITVNAMGLNKSSVSLNAGSSTTIKVINGKNVKWSTSNSKVAKIVSKTGKTAKIKGLKSGKATITAKIGKKKLLCRVTVKKKGSSNDTYDCRLDLSGAGIYSYSGTTKTVDIQKFANDDPVDFPIARNGYVSCTQDSKGVSSWSVSNPSVLTIQKINSEKILITYKKVGTAVIYANHEGKTFKWTINVTDSDTKYKTKRSQVYQQAGITSGMKPQYKCFLLAKWMCDHITYKPGSTNGQTYKEAFNEGTAVCGGYAHTYKYLLDGLGIPCEYVRSSSMNHAWNQVQIDGKWYDVDVSGMDYDQDNNINRGLIMNNFLMSFTQPNDLENAHTTDSRFEICCYLYACRIYHKSEGNKMDTSICNQEHNFSTYSSKNTWNLYCPWMNGEWINY